MKDKRFLVVEDEHSVADFIRAVIELEGGTAVLASTAERALECCRNSGPFDVMVLDLGLPDRSGWELLESARDFLPNCRVVIFSAQPPDDYAERTIPPSVVCSLVKPVAATTLRDALWSVLQPVPVR